MDLLRNMMANRAAKGVVDDPKPVGDKKVPKAQRAKKHEGGSKSMRHFIIEEKPSKKVVREHFEALVAIECDSGSESD